MYTSHNLAIMIKKQAKQQKTVIKDMLSECELGSNTMSALYHGKSIAFDSLAKIADYLDCSVDYLLGRTDNPNSHKQS
jgi:DNA-binding Xre family transcriptional regulator